MIALILIQMRRKGVEELRAYPQNNRDERAILIKD
jgi:hypothetical protein